MAWFKVWMNFGPGHQSYNETYLEVPLPTEDRVEESARYWAESDYYGDHYTVHWKKVKRPSKKFMEKEIEDLKNSIIVRKDYLERLTEKYNKWFKKEK